MSVKLPNAEDVNYWKTGKSSPDAWLDKAKRQIEDAGGQVLASGFGAEHQTGRAAYMLAFSFNGDQFRAVWPVLPSTTGNERAANIQAVTMLYHDIKARCMTQKVFGARKAFFAYLRLPDGRSAGDLAAPELLEAIPSVLRLAAAEEV